MKKLLCIIGKLVMLLSYALLIHFYGCASTRFRGPDWEMAYDRAGDQHLKNVLVYTIHPDGSCTIVQFESQDSEATALNNAITTLGNLAGGVK